MIDFSLHKPMTPSRLLRLVVEAVDAHLAIDKFRFELDTFGVVGDANSNEAGQCFGCFATAAICHLHGTTYPELIATIPPNQPSQSLVMRYWPSLILSPQGTTSVNFRRLRSLELAIDELRFGGLCQIGQWCFDYGYWVAHPKEAIEAGFKRLERLWDIESWTLNVEAWGRYRRQFLEVATKLEQLEQG